MLETKVALKVALVELYLQNEKGFKYKKNKLKFIPSDFHIFP